MNYLVKKKIGETKASTAAKNLGKRTRGTKSVIEGRGNLIRWARNRISKR